MKMKLVFFLVSQTISIQTQLFYQNVQYQDQYQYTNKMLYIMSRVLYMY